MQWNRPTKIDDALRWYARNPQALPLAGGTDIMVLWNAGERNDRAILDLSALRSWSRVRETETHLRLGALVTMSQVQQDARLAKRYPLLAQACATVGGLQIQNRATLAGNIANASPAGDSFPPLAVYEAQVQLVSAAGRRSLPLAEIFAGVKKTHLRPGELIAAIDLPLVKRPARQMFRKVGTRAAQAISKTVAAGLLWMRRDGSIRELRFALGSMAPTVRRLEQVEVYMQGRKLTGRTVEAACALLEEDVAPIDDLRSTRDYRLQVSRNLLRAFLRPSR
jgi:CO/xanthine dehydrogenase FAD-binding subunit